jgi:hypothetical protein
VSLATSLAGVSLPMRFAVLSVALLLVATVGFWPSYLAKPWKDIDAYTHLHATFGTAWMIILIAQPLLIRSRKMAAHRLLGRLTILLAAAFVVTGILLAHARFSSMPPEVFAKEAPFLSLPLSMTALFAAAYVLALQWRQSPPVHARFMAATAVALIDPALARAIYFLFPPLPALWMYQAISFPVMAGILVAMLISLPSGTRGKVAFQWFAICTITMLALFFVVPGTEAWLAFAEWFRELPLT